jgi:Tfp pilus assembly protein PilF
VDAHKALAQAYIKRGDHDAAAKEYKIAFRLHPKSVRIQQAMAMELAQTQNLDEAIVEMSIASHQFPLDEQLKLALNALLQLKNKERANRDVAEETTAGEQP